MRCEDVQRLVHMFVDDEVSRVMACEIERHLESCSACHLRVRRLRRLDDVLNGTPALPVPGGFASRVLGAARRRLLLDTAIANPISTPPRHRRITPLDAVAAAVLALGLSLGTWMASQTWRSAEGIEDLAANGLRSAQDIDGFYGAGSDEFDSQRPLLQAYMAVLDRNSLGE